VLAAAVTNDNVQLRDEAQVTFSDLQGVLLDGRYRLGARLGSGGMSVVYEADDLRLLRTVAIKLIRGQRSHTLVERLFREAKAAARADHPAVITVYGYGTDVASQLDYLVLERLRGSDLATRIAAARNWRGARCAEAAITSTPGRAGPGRREGGRRLYGLSAGEGHRGRHRAVR
jgi:hypothetical protein